MVLIEAFEGDLTGLPTDYEVHVRLGNCGNGMVEEADGEVCDDGNGVPGDGCSSSCGIEFGYLCDTSMAPDATRNNKA